MHTFDVKTDTFVRRKMLKNTLIMTAAILAVTLYVLSTEPVTNWRECRDPGAYRWNYDRDICIPEPKQDRPKTP